MKAQASEAAVRDELTYLRDELLEECDEQPEGGDRTYQVSDHCWYTRQFIDQ